ncbi:MAG TPA: DUF2249 domain-containing protein [Firmicutes bacterium]|nr:DUF2249 domain-containing protein [Bacillota bacterium]
MNEMLMELNTAIGKEKEYYEYVKNAIPKMQKEFLDKKFKGAGDSEEKKPEPDWMKDSGNFREIDARKSGEPFDMVTAEFDGLSSGEGFVLIQSFRPEPLIAYLEKKGSQTYVKKISEDEYRVYFYKKAGGE